MRPSPRNGGKSAPRQDDQAKIDALHEWMCRGAPPLRDGRSIVDAICRRLNDAGVPVDLFRLFVFTIHPLIKGRRLQWRSSEGTTIANASFALFDTDEYHDNPLPLVMKTRQPLRRRLIDPDCPADFRVLDELRAEGVTDYLVQPVEYIDGDVHTMSWSTRHADGFSEAAVAALDRLRYPLTRLIESYVLHLNAANILSTYVGRNAGERVLGGLVKRGDAEEISAVICFADLKNYTSLSNALPADAMLERLNRFFDALENPIGEAGGEILKFMGDGLLAIFPVDLADTGAAKAAVRKAAEALRQAHADLAAEGVDAFRSALHVGRLSYGNMGASRRLDFTAIGPAVNLTARLLGAAPALGADDVCSGEVAALLDGAPERLDTVALKGFDESVPVFRLTT